MSDINSVLGLLRDNAVLGRRCDAICFLPTPCSKEKGVMHKSVLRFRGA